MQVHKIFAKFQGPVRAISQQFISSNI